MHWISVEDKLPRFHCVVRVRMAEGTTTTAYFHADKMGWAHSHENFRWSYWQEKFTLKWLEDVSHWMPIERDNANKS